MEDRIESIIGRMTLEEKVSMVAGIDFWHTKAIERLEIPSVKVTDGPHGARTVSDDDSNHTIPATCFPTGVGMGATWNPELIWRIGIALGKETRARGCSVLLGPCVNIHRSPLGGRNFESFSEDPCLSSLLTVAYVEGVQSQGVATSAKHFALNNSEFERMTISSEADERTMREIYFPSFEKAVKEAGSRTVMCSYNRINGTHASENEWLLTEVLKKDWGFDGAVISDWFATHSTVDAANAGLDLEMPGPPRFFGNDLVKAVRGGEVEEELIDDKVRRILRALSACGAFEEPLQVSGGVEEFPEHRNLAREAAGEAIVLLKNQGNILPLDATRLKSIAVIGPNAAEARIEGGGSSEVEPYYAVAPLEGLRKKSPDSLRINYEPGCSNNILTIPLDRSHLVTRKSSGEPGLTGEYYDNVHLSGKPVATRTDKKFNLRWFGTNLPVPQVQAGNFSVRWTGYFRAEESGAYTFGLVSSQRARILIENTPVCVTEGNLSGDGFDVRAETTGEYAMESGKDYPIAIELTPDEKMRFPLQSIRVGCNPPRPPDLMERAVRAAADSEVAVVFAGLSEEYESEGFDRKEFNLPARQVQLINRITDANPRTIVVLNNGSPVGIADWIDNVPALVEAWYPGQECGNAIAGILFGDINPSGKLPDTFPRRLEDNPAYENYPGANGKVRYEEGIFVGYRHYDKNEIEPLFPFGHGLSYTSFAYDNLEVSPRVVKPGGKIQVRIEVKNTGDRAGKEVVQLYIHDIESRLPRPPKELKTFEKVGLSPGETRTVTFTLDESALSYYDPEKRGWTAEPGEFEVQIGSSSRDIRARTVFILLPD